MPLTPSRNSPITSETTLASSWGSLAISVMSMTTSDSLMDLSAMRGAMRVHLGQHGGGLLWSGQRRHAAPFASPARPTARPAEAVSRSLVQARSNAATSAGWESMNLPTSAVRVPDLGAFATPMAADLARSAEPPPGS